MIVACAECETKYSLPDENVPEKGIRVRCPKCKFVWRLKPASSAKSEFKTSEGAFSDDPSRYVERGEWEEKSEAQEKPSVQEEVMNSGFEEINIGDGVPFSEPEQPQVTAEMRKEKERAKRLARVFVSDILVYNQEKRDKALAEGNLMSVLGPEIKKGWEGYKEKVGSGITESNDYFKNALNEILANGQKLF